MRHGSWAGQRFESGVTREFIPVSGRPLKEKRTRSYPIWECCSRFCPLRSREQSSYQRRTGWGLGMGMYLFVKRAFDLTMSALALVVASPALAALAIAVRVTSPGP